jgi:rod shape-determining protein MreC
LNQLEEVLVITDTQAELPLQAKKDLAVGAATAEARAAAAKELADQQAAEAAAKSAAQIVADRLPSLQDATDASAATTAAGAAGTTPGGAVPKPLPTIHPDRYTPGTSPPAASLKPGAPEDKSVNTAPASSTETTPAAPQKPRKAKPSIETTSSPNSQPQ